ncbi:MAG: zinc-binding dehydrogenase [Clostridia bacterium]|nr:zinc-binding dehydrogenase [Clostridia bacterium]
MEPLACVLHGLAEAPVRPGGTALVLGAGAIGLLHLLVLRQRGRRVMVAARRPVRRELVTRLGGEFVQGAAADLLPAIREATGGRGVDLVVECTGDPAVWEQAPALARRGGHVVLFGGCPDGSRACFDTGRLHYDQVSLSSPFHFTPRDARAAFDLLATRRLDVRPLLTGTIALADLPAHFAALAARDPALATAVKTVVRPSGTTPQGPRGTTGG